MIHGDFPLGINVPHVDVSIFSGKHISHFAFVLDTGFSGGLKIDRRMADELRLIQTGNARFTNANGEKIRVGLTNAYAELEDKKVLTDILIFDGAPRAGIGLFSLFGYTAVVDCKNRTAHLELAR